MIVVWEIEGDGGGRDEGEKGGEVREEGGERGKKPGVGKRERE